MANSVSLVSLFESKKDTLENSLKGLVLPNNAKEIQEIVSNYLGELFDGEGDFRQNLTQSEDYILQASLSLLNAQKEISRVIESSNNSMPKTMSSWNNKQIQFSSEGEENNQDKKFGPRPDLLNVKIDSKKAFVGSSSGAIIGNVLFGGWGAVFGAIAGTAVVVYQSSISDNTNRPKPLTHLESQKDKEISNRNLSQSKPIDPKQFIEITSKICESVDNLIATFRAQINRVVTKYENQEKPSLEREYRLLVEEIQALIGYSRTHGDDDKFFTKIQQRIEDLAETLENYGLTIEDYTNEKEAWFNLVPSKNTTETKMVYPAIVKEGIVIIKGKAFIPA